MEVSISLQTLLFFNFIILGMLVSTFYDFLFCIRKHFKLKFLGTSICDLVFFLTFFCSFFIIIINLSESQVRNYIILGMILGCIFYYLTFSTLVKTLFFYILRCFHNTYLSINAICRKINDKLIKKFLKNSFNLIKNIVK